MAFDFPTSPSVGQQFSAGDITYQWNGYGWEMLGGDAAVTNVGDGPPLNPKNGTFWWESDTGILWIFYNDGSSSQWVEADKGGFSGATKEYVDTAALNAMSYSGMQVNGGMEIAQEQTTTSMSGQHPIDNWLFVKAGTSITPASQAITSGVFSGYNKQLGITVSTAQATMTAGDYVTLLHYIEGYRIAKLSWGTPEARPITVSFWTAHIRNGIYSGSIRNKDFTRTYPFTYTQNTAGVPQYNTIVIPGDTTGTWATDNTVGLRLAFSMACGSANAAPSSGSWIAGSFFAAPGQVNGVASTGDVFRLTGVTVLPGIYAPTAAQSPLIMRPFDQELITCQRYWQKTYPYTVAPGTASSNDGIIGVSSGTVGRPMMGWQYPSRMRATPTLIAYSPATGATGVARNLNTSADVAILTFGVSDKNCNVYPGSITFANGDALGVHLVVDARL